MPPLWAAAGMPSDYAELNALAAAAPLDVPLFDPDEDALLAPGDAPARITALCRAGGQQGPAGPVRRCARSCSHWRANIASCSSGWR